MLFLGRRKQRFSFKISVCIYIYICMYVCIYSWYSWIFLRFLLRRQSHIEVLSLSMLSLWSKEESWVLMSPGCTPLMLIGIRASLGFPVVLVVKNLHVTASEHKRCRFDPWVWKIPGVGNGNPLQYSCLEKSHGQRSLAGCGPQGCTELDVTEATYTHMVSLQLVWKGNYFKIIPWVSKSRCYYK